ncbi:Homeobox-leucine zipper protein HOX32 [Platanthera guangdongensis]|uniref:Homeobox-leucine zipper protein HOX32 n=1 Tax=Platanthera guangdongensis TaxID=2320717 RepID=A0ABR2M6Q0_9ASPA
MGERESCFVESRWRVSALKRWKDKDRPRLFIGRNKGREISLQRERCVGVVKKAVGLGGWHWLVVVFVVICFSAADEHAAPFLHRIRVASSLVATRICMRSLTASIGGPSGPTTPNFVRAEMLSSGYLIRPCEGGGSMIHIVDHLDLDAWSVPKVLRPLYESPKILAQKMTIAALQQIKQIAQEVNGDICYGEGCQPAVLRTFSQRLSRGFNDAINGFPDDGWSLMGSDGFEDVTTTLNLSSNKFIGPHSSSAMFSNLRNVPCMRVGNGFLGSHVNIPLAHTVENEEVLEVARLEGHGLNQDDFLLL